MPDVGLSRLYSVGKACGAGVVYRDYGKENGNYSSTLGHYSDNRTGNGNYYLGSPGQEHVGLKPKL